MRGRVETDSVVPGVEDVGGYVAGTGVTNHPAVGVVEDLPDVDVACAVGDGAEGKRRRRGDRGGGEKNEETGTGEASASRRGRRKAKTGKTKNFTEEITRRG